MHSSTSAELGKASLTVGMKAQYGISTARQSITELRYTKAQQGISRAWQGITYRWYEGTQRHQQSLDMHHLPLV
jgi:hypothetical protein